VVQRLEQRRIVCPRVALEPAAQQAVQPPGASADHDAPDRIADQVVRQRDTIGVAHEQPDLRERVSRLVHPLGRPRVRAGDVVRGQRAPGYRQQGSDCRGITARRLQALAHDPVDVCLGPLIGGKQVQPER
jgi:hypothetical protein